MARQLVWVALVISIWSIAPHHAEAEGELEGLRDDVRTAPAASAHDEWPHWSRSDASDEPSWGDNSQDEAKDFLGMVFLGAVTSPIWGPHVLMEDNLANQSRFLSYPYKRDWDGSMLIESDEALAKWWQVRASGEYADDFHHMSRVGGRVLVDTAWRIGFDSSFDYREEELLPDGEDHLWTGDMNVLVRFAQNEFMQMRAGIGANWLTDAADTNWGFNFTYGGDIMPLQPFILSAEIDWGRLGHAGLFHGRTTVGVEYQHVELYTGFDYFDVGETQIHGWVAGTRLWF